MSQSANTLPVRRVNQSEMTTFLRCPRKWNLSYLRGFTSEGTNSALNVGTLVHAGLEAHYSGSDPFDPIERAWAVAADGDPDFDGADYKLAHLMIDGYLEWLEDTGIDADLTPEFVEQKLEVPLGCFGDEEWVLHGTIDWTARDPHGQTWLFDHKTVAAFGALVDRRLQLSFQLLTYAWMLWQTTGEVPAGVALNMLRKVKRTAAAKPPFYAREYVHFNKTQLLNHEQHLRKVAWAMYNAEAESYHVPVPDQDCTWKCPFIPVCAMMDDGSDIEGALNELYVRR